VASESLLQPAAAGKDAELREASPGSNYGGYASMYVNRATAAARYRSLIQWDLSGLGVTQGSQIAFAKMLLHPAQGPTGTFPATAQAKRLTASWVESEVTWNSRQSGVGWGAPGGDFDSATVDSQDINTGARDSANCWFSFLLTQTIRDWLDGVYSNYGLLLKLDQDQAASTTVGFRASDHATAGERPILWVENKSSPMNLVPTGPGYYQQWQNPSYGMPHYEAVCLPPNLGAGVEPLDDYSRSINSGVSGLVASFVTSGGVPGSASISSVKVAARVRRYASTGYTEGQVGLRVAGADYWHATGFTENAGVWTEVAREWTTNPATGQPWTAAEANALEPLIKRTGGSVSCRMCRMYVEVTFSEVTAKSGSDSGQGAEAGASVLELTAKSGSDSAATDKERAGYYTLERMFYIPEGPGGPPWMWVFHPGVEAFYERQQDGAATEGAGQVVHNQLAASDSGALMDQKVEPPVVEHVRQEPGSGVDLAALWYEIALSDSNASADDQAVLEINPVGASDTGAGADSAQTPVGYYEGMDAGVAADASAGLSAALSEIADAATAIEAAERIAILSRHIMECSIESSLDALADAFDLTLVESDPSNPLTPKAQAWRSLDEGDLVQVRLGLAGLGFDDYGVFRIDGAAVRVSERQIVTELHGRDKAALLIEERGRDPGGAYFAFGAYPEQDATEAARPYCSSIARLLAARVGLGLVWDAPNYPLKEFTVRPDESVSSALSRLLGPLQVGRRYRADAWVDGDNLVVRRRGNGPILGGLDCRQGMVRSISRERQPTVGEVTVLGGTEVIRTTYVPEDHHEEKGSDERESQVEIEDDGSGHRVVRTYLQQPDGRWVQTQEEVEDQIFEEVWDGDHWIGRVLLESRTTITTNMHLATSKTERRTTKLSYDGDWRLIRREESKRVYDSDSHEFELKEKSLVRFEQITPTDVRTTTTEWKVVDGELKVKKDYPTRVEQPGTLQSALHISPSPDHAWDQNEDGKQPERWRKVEETRQYYGRAVETPGGIPREHSDANLMSDGACQQIAADMASESGKWLYQFELFWPRPLPYRKGDRVTLTHLPADVPDMIAIITRVRTQFSVAGAAWTHDVSLEAWPES
jgi:hypothetical protein